MSSTDSLTDNSSTVQTTDNRQAVTDDAMAFGAGSTVRLNIVADEAFALGGDALAYGQEALRTGQSIAADAFNTVGRITARQQENNDGDLVRIADKLATWAIPAALIGFALIKVAK